MQGIGTFYILLAIAIIVFTIYAAMQFGKVAVSKGHSDKKTMIIVLCIFVPIAGYLLTCALPDNTRHESKACGSGRQNVVSDELPEL